MLDPEQVANFADQLAAASEDKEREEIRKAFLEYASDFIQQFSYHYRDFLPLPNGNVACKMDGYIRPRDRVDYIVDTRTGFIRPVKQDAQRGVHHQELK
jgi:hypothetical protein